MLKPENIKTFINKNVSVGVDHIIIHDRLFFYYGVLVSVSETDLTLKTKNGYKIVPLDQVKDVHLDARRDNSS